MSTSIKTRTFSDINLLFTSHPVTADINKKLDDEAIKASVRNLISTKNYERPFHPEIGCQVHSLLFELLTPVTLQVIKQTVYDVLNKFEPRVTVTDVKVRDRLDNNEIEIEVSFRINNTNRPVTLRTALARVR